MGIPVRGGGACASASALGALALIAGCLGGSDSADGSDGSGLECESDRECSSGLSCHVGRCVAFDDAGSPERPGDAGGFDAAAGFDAGVPPPASWDRRPAELRTWFATTLSWPVAPEPDDDCDYGPRPDGFAMVATDATYPVVALSVDATHLWWAESEPHHCTNPRGGGTACDHNYAVRRAPRCGGTTETLIGPELAVAGEIQNLQVAAHDGHFYFVTDTLTYRDPLGTLTSLGLAEACVAALEVTAAGVFVIDSCSAELRWAPHGTTTLANRGSAGTGLPLLAVNDTHAYFDDPISELALDGSGTQALPTRGTQTLFVEASNAALAISVVDDNKQSTAVYAPPMASEPVILEAPDVTGWYPLSVTGTHVFLPGRGDVLMRVALADLASELVYAPYYQAITARADRPYFVAEGRAFTPTALTDCEPPTETASWAYEYGPLDARITAATAHPEGGVVVAGYSFGGATSASVARLDSDGEVLWFTGIDEVPGLELDAAWPRHEYGCLLVAPDGSVYVGGNQGVQALTAEGEPSWGLSTWVESCALDAEGQIVVLESASGGTAFVVDAAGARQLEVTLPDSAPLAGATTAMATDPIGGGVLVSSGDLRGQGSLWLGRLDAELAVVWSERIDGMTGRVFATPDGGAVAIGPASAAVAVAGTTTPVPSGPRTVSVRFNQSGDLQGVTVLGATPPHDALALASGEILLVTESCPACVRRLGTDFPRYSVDRYASDGTLRSRVELPGFGALVGDGAGAVVAGSAEYVMGDPYVDGYIGLKAFVARVEP